MAQASLLLPQGLCVQGGMMTEWCRRNPFWPLRLLRWNLYYDIEITVTTMCWHGVPLAPMISFDRFRVWIER
jgi:hypothetical protein